MLKHLFWISGRANRTEFLFWSFVLNVFCWLLIFSLPKPGSLWSIGQMLWVLTALGLTIISTWPTITVCIRRLHDMNCSGWWIVGIWILNFLLKNILPGGALMYIIFLSIPGTTGPNRFGNYNKHYYPAFMKNGFVWAIGVILLFISLVIGQAVKANLSQMGKTVQQQTLQTKPHQQQKTTIN